MYELKKIGKVFTSKFVGTGPSSYEKRIYRAAVSQRLRNTVLEVSEHFKSSENCMPDRSVSTYRRLEESQLFHVEDPVVQEYLKYRLIGPHTA
jgi:hypothetical protein